MKPIHIYIIDIASIAIYFTNKCIYIQDIYLYAHVQI